MSKDLSDPGVRAGQTPALVPRQASSTHPGMRISQSSQDPGTLRATERTCRASGAKSTIFRCLSRAGTPCPTQPRGRSRLGRPSSLVEGGGTPTLAEPGRTTERQHRRTNCRGVNGLSGSGVGIQRSTAVPEQARACVEQGRAVLFLSSFASAPALSVLFDNCRLWTNCGQKGGTDVAEVCSWDACSRHHGWRESGEKIRGRANPAGRHGQVSGMVAPATMRECAQHAKDRRQGGTNRKAPGGKRGEGHEL
ncbi:hypothetical protein B0T25DRAFT_295282 [Lasiosphaeria hispida]|uniref:Uncharacterized protein n=1 Tax=Lasiosphaeria hispida TaxID=260671 RepID=A0AAJ0MBD3_9PEZI|nr:hypothetical protein B0T25DRAFT_295282 [Lasiosphaeria hispida]